MYKILLVIIKVQFYVMTLILENIIDFTTFSTKK